MLSLSWDTYVSFPGAMLVGEGGFPVHYVFFWEISLTWSLLTPPPQMLLEPDPFPAQILDPTASVAAVSSLYGLSSWTPNSSIKVSYPHINLNHGNLPLHCCCNKIWIWISLSPFSLSLIHTHRVSLSPSNSSIHNELWPASLSMSLRSSFGFTTFYLAWDEAGRGVCAGVFPLFTMGRMTGLSLIPSQPTVLNIVLAGSWTEGSG